MSLESNNIPMLSEVPRECPKLEMFYLYCTAKIPKSVEIPSNFFSEMEKLKVLGLAKLGMFGIHKLDMQSLLSSLQFLKNLQTLCLEQCVLGDIALVGHLSNLEILSFARSNIKQIPKEIGQLIRLRWLNLSDCVNLDGISPDVISKLKRLEDLSMRNSFDKWKAERGGSNASLLELKLLSQLTALEICIPDANILPTNLFSNKLVRYQIYIGDAWEETMAETTLNTLKLKLTTSNELDQVIKTLLKRCEDLTLDGSESGDSIVYQLDIEDFQQLKHLSVQNNVDFTYIMDRKVKYL
jgi:Leucine-rich repeat (LRR) protein